MLRKSELPASVRESAARIHAEALRLDRMILSLLDLAKADEGRLSPRFSDVDLQALVEDVLAELNLSAKRRSVTLECSLEAQRICVDEDLFRRALANLVENAIRHAPPESSVIVISKSLPGGISVRVLDRGPGIPLDMRERIFEPFVQIESEDGGVARACRGLGLSFCKLAIEAHGGRVWVEDAAPGAVFCVRLPPPPVTGAERRSHAKSN